MFKLFNRKIDTPVATAVADLDDDLHASTFREEIDTEEDAVLRRQHAALAEKLGVTPAFVGTSLLSVLREEGVQIFNRQKVQAYLDKKGTWKWYAMRESDTKRGFPLYTEVIPFAVLATVEKILARVPNAEFLVAALVKDPDPFLAVGSVAEKKWYIIERWDEPGFRG